MFRVPLENKTVRGDPLQKKRFSDVNVNHHYKVNAEIFFGYDSGHRRATPRKNEQLQQARKRNQISYADYLFAEPAARQPSSRQVIPRQEL